MRRVTAGEFLAILAIVAVAICAVMEFRADTLGRRNAYRARMLAAADSLRWNHGMHTFPCLPDDPPGTAGDTLYVWWGGREVKAVWPVETPRRHTDGR